MKSDAQRKKTTFTLAYKDPRLVTLMETAAHKIVAIWAIDCAERVLPYFEVAYPDDPRPRNAIKTLQAWIESGVFRMAEIRAAALASHAAAREVGADNQARSAARAAGQAVATAHVRTHAIGAANYAAQAIYRASDSAETDSLIAKERDWQYQRLLTLLEAGAN
jgi:hypothetical protein